MNIEELYKRLLPDLNLISTDSRTIVEGSIFFALKGEKFNGNQFANQALEKGARLVIIDEDISIADPRLIRVQNVLLTLQSLAHWHRKQMMAKVIAITGSNGKTSTKELLFSIFKEKYKITATEGNLNNHIGVPLSLLKIRPEHNYAIIEMGANHLGEIKQLSEIASPDIGIITSIGKAHLEGFGDLNGVIRAKFELFQYLDGHQGISFYNLNQSELAELFSQKINHIGFGDYAKKGKYQYELISHLPKITLNSRDENNAVYSFNSNLFGLHNYQNVIAAISIARFCKIENQLIQNGLNQYTPKNLRSQLISWKGSTVYMDAYNANPSSMRVAIETIDDWDYDEKWLILGKMAELGNESAHEHQWLVQFACSKNFHKVICVGEEYENLQNEFNIIYFRGIEQCREWMNMQALDGKMILIKGSRSAHLETIVQDE